MIYTSHGLMTPEDLADHHALYDTGPAEDCGICGGPLASDGVCADDDCGDDLPDDLPFEDLYGIEA
jgi:hypothetical protein